MLTHRPIVNAIRSILVIAALTCSAALADRALAEDGSFIGVVTGENVFVRSGPADSYYPIGRVNTGDLVKVVGERFGWARIHTVGPTFDREEFFGYIIYPKTQPGRFRLADDGKTGRTLGRMDVLAPNLNTDFNPNDSWKPLIRLDADTTVRVIETRESANNLVQKVALPDEAEVWVSMRFIQRAEEQQRLAWRRHFEPEKPKAEQKAQAKPEAKPETRAEKPMPQRVDKPAERPEQPAAEAKVEAEAEAKPERQREAHPPALAREEQPAPAIERMKDQEPARVREEVADEPADVVEPIEAEVALEPAERDREPRPEPEVEVEVVADTDETYEGDETTMAELLATATLEALEEAFEQLRNEPIETAEVLPLRRMYLGFAERAENERDQRFAAQRAEQLELWAQIQQNRQRLARLKARAELTGERAEAARRAVDDSGDYTAVGTLAVSTIYDGRRLPRLLRLQEPGTGRTVAYVQPDTDYDLTGMIGQLIGVIGEKEYDGGLRLNLISPRRVDILAPRD